MTWVRLDENFAEHPKVARAGPLGMAMHVAALCYCNRHLTDGFIPKEIVRTLLDFTGLGMRMWDGDTMGGGQDAQWDLVVDDLVNAGLWEPTDDGWLIHDYHDYQPSKEHVQAVRKERQAAGRKSGESRRLKQSTNNSEANDEQSVQQNAIKCRAKTEPVPDSESKKKREGASTQTVVVAKSADPTPDLPPFPESLRRGTRLSLESLPDDWRRFCEAEREDLDPERTWAIFQDHWRGKAGKDGTKLHWLATWRNWVRREGKGNGISRQGGEEGRGGNKDERAKAALLRGLAIKLPEPPQ